MKRSLVLSLLLFTLFFATRLAARADDGADATAAPVAVTFNYDDGQTVHPGRDAWGTLTVHAHVEAPAGVSLLVLFGFGMEGLGIYDPGTYTADQNLSIPAGYYPSGPYYVTALAYDQLGNFTVSTIVLNLTPR